MMKRGRYDSGAMKTASLGIMHQNTIDELGRIIEKEWLTHDQSYMFGSGTLVNSRIRTDELMPCMYGACLRRLVYWACAARAKYPGIKIYATVGVPSMPRKCSNSVTVMHTTGSERRRGAALNVFTTYFWRHPSEWRECIGWVAMWCTIAWRQLGPNNISVSFSTSCPTTK